MKLIVGLGNPGPQYERTRHNVGFLAVRKVASALGASISSARFRAFTAEGRRGTERVFLMLPQTYMNLSGQSVAQAVAFYKLVPQDIIVVHDDLDLPAGKLRVRRGGSDGGHNGIRSIIESCGCADFARVKIGIDRPTDNRFEPKAYVLAQCSAEELQLLDEQAEKASAAVLAILDDGLEKAMNVYNTDPKPPRAPRPPKPPRPEKEGALAPVVPTEPEVAQAQESVEPGGCGHE